MEKKTEQTIEDRGISAKEAYIELKKKRVAKAPVKSRIVRAKDRVNTPNGDGIVHIIDPDGTVCVELDNDNTVLHEFDRKEISKL